jgi:hypothetical protein
MIEVAKSARGTITYGDLAGRIQNISFEPDDPAFHKLLGEIRRSSRTGNAQRRCDS